MEVSAGDIPDATELESLYRSVGWDAYADAAGDLADAVERSAYVVTARDDGELVGLARAVSDDYSIAYLQDILVAPSHQRRGIGRALMEAFLATYGHVRLKVLLTDREEAQSRFYESMGFTDASMHPAGLRSFVRFDAR